MKVSAGNDIAVIGKNEWIIGRRARFDGQNLLAMRERAADRAMHLRHAPQAVGILDARVILRVRRADFAFAQEREKVARDRLLPGMRPSLVDTRVECGRRALERLECHCAGHIRDARETFRAPEREAADGVHRLGAVEEGESFLGLQIRRLQSRLLQRARARADARLW